MMLNELSYFEKNHFDSSVCQKASQHSHNLLPHFFFVLVLGSLELFQTKQFNTPKPPNFKDRRSQPKVNSYLQEDDCLVILMKIDTQKMIGFYAKHKSNLIQQLIFSKGMNKVVLRTRSTKYIPCQEQKPSTALYTCVKTPKIAELKKLPSIDLSLTEEKNIEKDDQEHFQKDQNVFLMALDNSELKDYEEWDTQTSIYEY